DERCRLAASAGGCAVLLAADRYPVTGCGAGPRLERVRGQLGRRLDRFLIGDMSGLVQQSLQRKVAGIEAQCGDAQSLRGLEAGKPFLTVSFDQTNEGISDFRFDFRQQNRELVGSDTSDAGVAETATLLERFA